MKCVHLCWVKLINFNLTKVLQSKQNKFLSPIHFKIVTKLNKNYITGILPKIKVFCKVYHQTHTLFEFTQINFPTDRETNSAPWV